MEYNFETQKNFFSALQMMYGFLWLLQDWNSMLQPCKHAISCQYRACTGPMLAASAHYRPGTGT